MHIIYYGGSQEGQALSHVGQYCLVPRSLAQTDKLSGGSRSRFFQEIANLCALLRQNLDHCC